MSHPPQHIAIIMDGNNRWAVKNNVSMEAGYRKGSETAEKIINHCAKIGIKYLTLYAFSLENWKRSRTEVDLIMSIFQQAMLEKLDEVSKSNIRVLFIGDRSMISRDILDTMKRLETLSRNNDGLWLIIAISYSARNEIMNVAKTLAGIQTCYEEAFYHAINPHDIPDPDLLIRTSGEMRVSNFLLWQIAYTELYFTRVLWPDFDEKQLNKACNEFKLRNRRFGIR